MDAVKKKHKIDVSVQVIAFSLVFPILCSLVFTSMQIIYTKLFTSILGGLQASIINQEWRIVKNGVYSGWGVLPGIESVCGKFKLTGSRVIDECSDNMKESVLRGEKISVELDGVIFDLTLESSLWIPSFLISLTIVSGLLGIWIFVSSMVNRRIRTAIRSFRENRRSGSKIDYFGLIDYVKSEVDAERSKSIARTSQALCHDVRKPLSMFKLILDSMISIKNPSDFRRFAATAVPEVNRALAQADSLINDLMSINARENALTKEVISAELLISTALEDIFRVYPNANLPVKYEIASDSVIEVDKSKISRVFSNIIGNAIQAVKNNEYAILWFKTSKINEFVEFTIGNSGSKIPQKNLSQLFEAFFTSDKKGGTGLGLAIAKKWVSAHGGKIRCESGTSEVHPSGYVEFVFSLPKAAAYSSQIERPVLPKHSNEVADEFNKIKPASDGVSVLNDEVRRELQDHFGKRSVVLKIGIVDDEQAYSQGLVAQFRSILPDNVSAEYTVVSQMVDFVGNQKYDLLFVDVDMGEKSLNGFDLIYHYRHRDKDGIVAVHSNRLDSDFLQKAIDSGANHTIPKPATLEVLARLLKESLPAEKDIDKLSKPTNHRKKVVMVDDDQIFLKSWEISIGKNVKFIPYTDPKKMLSDFTSGTLNTDDIALGTV